MPIYPFHNDFSAPLAMELCSILTDVTPNGYIKVPPHLVGALLSRLSPVDAHTVA